MADSVNIDNVGGEGVASEVTLKQLLITMELLANKTGASSQAAINAAQEQYKKSLKGLSDEVAESKKKTEAHVSSTKKSTAANKRYAIALGVLTNTLGVLRASANGLANELINGGTDLKNFTDHIPLLGEFLGPFASFIDETIHAFRELSSVGAAFGNSLTALRTAAATTGLSIDEFSSLIASNSETIRVLGGTVDQGILRFRDLNKTIKQTGDFDGLRQLGYTTAELNEGILSYIELQTRLGRMEARSNRELTDSAAAYMRQIDLLAKVTGKSRKEVEAAMQDQAADAGFRALEAELAGNEEALANFRISMGIIDSQSADVATGLKDLADGAAQTEAAQKLIALAGPEIADAMVKIGKGADPSVLINALGKAGDSIEGFAGATGAERKILIDGLRLTDPVLAGILDAGTELQRARTIDIEAAKKAQELKEEESEALLAFEDSVRSVRTAIQTMLIDSGVLGAVTTGMGHLASTLSSPAVIDAIKTSLDFIGFGLRNFADLISSPELHESVGSFVDTFVEKTKIVIDFFSDLSGWGLAGIIAGGFGALFASKALASTVSNKIGNWVSSALGSSRSDSNSNGPSPGNRRRSALGSLGSSLGGFFGGLSAGVLEGAALGLKAFANPKVLLGAVNIGLVVTAIGAGIAGASWILGKLLPTFIEGIRGFDTIDGEHLKQVGTGLAVLGGGLAAMGAGQVVGFMGQLAGTVGEAWTKLTGSDSPIEQLMKFSQYKITSEQVDQIRLNASAFEAYALAMGKFGTGAVVSGVGDIVSSIGSFFSGGSPLEQLEEFANHKFTRAQIEQITTNAEAITTFGTAFQHLAQSKITDIDLDIGSSTLLKLKSLGEINGQNLQGTADGLTAIANIKGFETKLSSLKELNSRDVDTYRRSLDKLVDTLERMNKQLEGDTGWAWGSGKKDSKEKITAGSIVNQMHERENSNQVNNTALLSVLQEIRDLNKKTLRSIDNQSGTV